MQDPLRFLERQPFEKQIVDQRKDRRVEADPEREGNDGDERERRRLPEFSKRETKVVHSNAWDLFRAQCLNWIDKCGAARRQQTRDQCRAGEEDRRAAE